MKQDSFIIYKKCSTPKYLTALQDVLKTLRYKLERAYLYVSDELKYFDRENLIIKFGLTYNMMIIITL